MEKAQGENGTLKTNKEGKEKVMMKLLSNQRLPGTHLQLNKLNGSLRQKKMHTMGEGHGKGHLSKTMLERIVVCVT